MESCSHDTDPSVARDIGKFRVADIVRWLEKAVSTELRLATGATVNMTAKLDAAVPNEQSEN